MTRVLLSVLFTVLFIPVYSQITISGKVTDIEGEPLPALVTIETAEGMDGFCIAGNDGSYTISFEPTTAEYIIKASLLGFDPIEKSIAAENQTVDFLMTEGSIELKEVVVVPDKITQRGDTLNYTVGAYKGGADRVIGDVIKKMPGLEVSESGQIAFNGKTVKNFYVEDMVLLQGRYGIATNNISAGDVATVQVYQNHQPIKALTDWNPSDEVTINLKLKPSAKGTFSLNGMAGIGYKPLMWATEAVGMYFGRKGQNITTYKGNNCGDNIKSEYANMSGDGPMTFLNKAPLSIVTPGSPGVAQKRYLQNRSNTISSNTIIKTDSMSSLNIGVTYLDDILKKEGNEITEQYLPDGSYRNITQKVTSRSHTHDLSGSIRFNRNTPKTYIDNTLHINAGWDKETALNRTTADFMEYAADITQKLDNPSFSIDDKMALIRTSDKNKSEFYITAGWNHRPQSLEVSPASVFNQESGNGIVSQSYTTDDFKGSVSTNFARRIGNVSLNGLIYGQIDIESVKSDLDGLDKITDAINDYRFGQGEAGIELRPFYSVGNIYFELGLPVCYSGQWACDLLDRSRDRNWHYINFAPSLKMTYSLGKSWWGLSTHTYLMRNNSERIVAGAVMTDYLTLREFRTDRTLSDRVWYSTAEYHYTNALRQIFANASASWIRDSSNTLTGYEYDGLQTVRNTYDVPNVSNSWQVTANFSKGIPFLDSTLKINGVFSKSSNRQIIDIQPLDYSSLYWSANMMYAVAPTPWFGGALAVAYGESLAYAAHNRDNASASRQYTGRLDLNFFPMRTLVLNIGIEDNYTNLTANSRNAWFGDVKVKYKKGRFDWELEFNNIFNRKTYTKVRYSNMDLYQSTYMLRPRNVMLKVRFKIL